MSFRPVRLLIVAVVGVAQLTVAANASGKEQTTFSAEVDRFDSPVVLPAAALAELAKDEQIKDLLADNRPADGVTPQSWYTASLIHLAGSSESDLIVMELRCGNVCPFWILRPSNKSFEIIFNGSVHSLSVLRARSNGYRDIELLSATCCVLTTTRLRFDGTQYQIAAQKAEDIK